jgi:hypothetical protein
MHALRQGRYKIVPGNFYGTPKEVWGFRQRIPEGTPNQMARRFLAANAELLGLAGLLRKLSERALLHSLGATHVILQQSHAGIPIHRGFVTVHISRDNQVFLVKNRAVPRSMLGGEARFRITRAEARDAALHVLDAAKDTAKILKVERRWYPLGHLLRPSLRVRVQIPAPRQDEIVYVDASDASIISVHDNVAKARGIADVFNPNPVIALGDHRPLLSPGGRPRVPPEQTYERVELRDLAGNGRLDGRRVSTRPTPNRVRRANHEFLLWSDENGFEEVMTYYHLDQAIGYLEKLGFERRRAIFTERVQVNARATDEDQSWYDPGSKSLSFGTGGINDAEDAETILHEFGHALQDAICPDFGQSREAAAMGEGFGDYFAASFFAGRKKRPYIAAIMSWDAITYDDYDPPSLRRLDENVTFDDFWPEPDYEHDNGRIWSATLWDIWRSLGRRVADKIIIESHFQLDGFTTFARGARAILDADRNLYRNRHRKSLLRIFGRRRIGPVA